MFKYSALSAIFDWRGRKRLKPWRSPERWGAPMVAIDFLSHQNLLEDRRVDKVHKEQYPRLCEDYVLWRVEHDGSCWVSSAMTQLLYQMVEAGPKKFDEALGYFKALLASDKQGHNQVVADDFLAILGLMREKMDHGYCLALRNYRNVYEALDRGFRKILSLYWLEHDAQKAQSINTAFSLGFAADFKKLFEELGFKYAEFLTDGECQGASATESYFDLRAYVSEHEVQALLTGEGDAQHGEKMPAVMSFLSEPGFMDVAVRTEMAKKIKAKAQKYYGATQPEVLPNSSLSLLTRAQTHVLQFLNAKA